MGKRAWHTVLFALLPGLIVSVSIAGKYQTARRIGPPSPPPDLEVETLPEPDELVIDPGHLMSRDYYGAVPSCKPPRDQFTRGVPSEVPNGCKIQMTWFQLLVLA